MRLFCERIERGSPRSRLVFLEPWKDVNRILSDFWKIILFIRLMKIIGRIKK